MDWEKAAVDNLIPLSQEQSDLKIALAEWYYTEDVEDYGMPAETCQLCNRSGLRYHFEIKNSKTENTLLIGSGCIERFDIAVYGEDSQLLEGKAKSKKLQDKIKSFKIEKAVQALRDLWLIADKGDRKFIKSNASKIKYADGFSPNNTLSLFKLFNTHQIDYDPQLYKVNLRSNQHKDQVLHMSEQDRNTIWEALGDKQRTAINKYQKEVERIQAEAEAGRQEALKRAEERKQQLEKLRAEKIKWAEERKRQLEKLQIEKIKQLKAEKATRSTKFSGPKFDITQALERQMKGSTFFQEAKALQTTTEEAVCELCGQMTTKWYAFDNKTKKCKCMDCYRRQEGKK